MRQVRPGWAPSVPRGRWCAPARPDSSGRHPPPCNGRPLSPAGASHRAEVPMTRRHRGFTCVHPSGLPQPVTPGWNRDPWAFPRASHLAVTRDARRGGDGPCARDRTLHPRRHAAPPSMSVAVLMRLACRTIWFSQLAWTGRCTSVVLGQAALIRAIEVRPACEEPLSTTQNTRLARAVRYPCWGRCGPSGGRGGRRRRRPPRARGRRLRLGRRCRCRRRRCGPAAVGVGRVGTGGWCR